MSKLVDKLYYKALVAKTKVSQILKDETGDTNIIAIIIILAIVIALAIVFKTQLSSLFNKIWTSLFQDVDNVLN